MKGLIFVSIVLNICDNQIPSRDGFGRDEVAVSHLANRLLGLDFGAPS